MKKRGKGKRLLLVSVIILAVVIVLVLVIGLVVLKYSKSVKYSPACRDSDGGLNLYLKGTAISGTSNYTDFCRNSTKIEEMWCNSAGAIVHSVRDCQTGSKCVDGECLSPCTDSDGGIDPYTRGTVINYPYVVPDMCSEDTNTYSTNVIENYCSNGKWRATVLFCPSGCKDGACILTGT